MAEVRLIDANAIFPNDSITVWSFDGEETARGILKAIDNAPTIEAVPVVRCKECRHNEDEDYCPFVRVSKGANWLEIIKPHADGFCYKGEKMDGGEA